MTIIVFLLIWAATVVLLFLWSIHVYNRGYFEGYTDGVDYIMEGKTELLKEAYPEMFVEIDEEETGDGEP